MSITRLLKTLEKTQFGSLDLVTPDGVHHRFDGKETGVSAHLEIHNLAMIGESFAYGTVGMARSYKKGLWESENVADLLQFGLQNQEAFRLGVSNHPMARLIARLYYSLRNNSIARSRKNIAHHYDLGNSFYSLWLDKSMTYSSGIFHEKNDDIETAQANKIGRIIDKLQKKQHVLEIGCGWGSFADQLLSNTGSQIDGITLSEEQYHYATERLQKYGNRANIELRDYRHVNKKYDAIVSIEMFEAVGEKYWKTYFDKIAASLKSHGKALIQTITIDDAIFHAYRKNDDMIRSYIFPGGMLPSQEKFQEEAIAAGLKICDQFFFGDSYVQTLQNWLKRFDENENDIRLQKFEDEFIRLWRFYLHFCIAGFRSGRTNVMQVELSHA